MEGYIIGIMPIEWAYKLYNWDYADFYVFMVIGLAKGEVDERVKRTLHNSSTLS